MNALSKEEIIGLSFYPHECGSMIDCVTKQDAIKAMDEYAEQEAIAFQHFTEFKTSDDDWLNEKGELISMKDAYQLYLKSKEK